MDAYSRKANALFQQIVVNKYVEPKRNDWAGYLLKEDQRALERFSVPQMAREAPMVLADGKRYRDALLYRSLVETTPLVLPKVNGRYLFSRMLKASETERMPSRRFVNAVLLYAAGVRTPQPVAEIDIGDRATFVTEYRGESALMTVLHSGLPVQDVAQRKQIAKNRIDYWALEAELGERYGWLPSTQHLLDEFIGLFQLKVSPARWSELLDQMTVPGKDLQTNWGQVLAFLGSVTRASGQQPFPELERYRALHAASHLPERVELIRDEGKMESLAARIGDEIRTANDKGFLLTEVAPRDITVDADWQPWFVDTELLEYRGYPLSKRERDKQEELFHKELRSQRKGWFDKKRFEELVIAAYRKD